MTEWIKSIIQNGSYPGIVFLMLAENLFPPIPSELIMPLAGFVSSQGGLSLAGVAIAGTVGSVLGAIALYYVGYAAGAERLQRWSDRHGHWVGLSSSDLEKSRGWFEHHGAKTVFFCRLVPGIRSLISIPAGVARMHFTRFLLYTTLGSAVWSTALAVAGGALGRNHTVVERVIGPISTIVVGALIIAWLVRIVRHRRQARPS